jgi:hypothetical protein
VGRTTLAQFLVLTMADFCDQLFNWQDRLFDNSSGRLEYRGNRCACAAGALRRRRCGGRAHVRHALPGCGRRSCSSVP